MDDDRTPWVVPPPSWRARRYCATKFTDKTVPHGDGTLELAADESGAPSFARRIRRLRRGKRLTLSLLVEGRLPWCPPYPSGHPVRLTADAATTDGGGGPSTERVIPLAELQVVDARLLDPPTRPIVPGLETWTLTLAQGAGRAAITGLLADLVLLAYVGGWPPPAAYRTHRHAGAAGVDLGPAPGRPPIRLWGWLLMALGVAVVGLAVVGLVVGDHLRGIAGVGSGAGVLLLSGWQMRRRRPPRRPSTPPDPS